MFGSTCYAYDHSAKKLDPRSKKGIFFGYDRQSPAYLVYLPETGTVRRFRCIKCFNELYYKNNIDNNDKNVDQNSPIPSEIMLKKDIFFLVATKQANF